MHDRSETTKGSRPLPLLIGFGVFLVAMGYLVAASLTRRTAPTFAARDEARGDTLTVDATEGDKWRYVSLTRGRVLTGADTAGWEMAVKRYNLVANGDAIDVGVAAFDSVRAAPPAEANSSAIPKWYRYNLLTHLLEPNGHVYVVRRGSGQAYKIQILSYYCPGLTAGCVTLRYAPLAGAASSAE